MGIVAALPIEVGDLLDGLQKVWKYKSVAVPVIEGEYAGKIVAVSIAGMGRATARARPTSLSLATGRAGSSRRVSPVLLTPPTPATTWSSPAKSSTGTEVATRSNNPRTGGNVKYSTGRLLTVDQLVLRAAEKGELHQSYKADLIDMESSAVAAICREQLVRFLSIRVISDDAHRDLPAEVAGIINSSGSYRVGAALRSVSRRPSSLKDFWSLYEHSLEAADRLSKFIKRCLDDLPL